MRNKKRNRPLVLNVCLSISFIALAIAIISSALPSVTIWTSTTHWLDILQRDYLELSVTEVSRNVKQTVETKLNSCENRMAIVVKYSNGWLARKLSPGAVSVPLDLAVNETGEGASMLVVHGGFATSYSVFVDEGMFIITANTVFGDLEMIQRGFDSNYSSQVLPYLRETFLPNWDSPYFIPIIPYLPLNGITDTTAKILASGSLHWGNIRVPKNGQQRLIELQAGLILPGKSEIAGLHMAMISPSEFISLIDYNISDGILCVFVQDYTGCLITSTCEPAFYNRDSVYTDVYTPNSTLWEVRDSSSLLQTAIARNSSEAITFKRANYTVAYLGIQSKLGFKAMSTVIAGFFPLLSCLVFTHFTDTKYFQSTFNHVQKHTRICIVVCSSFAVLLSGTLAAFIFGGHLDVIQRIKRISDASIDGRAVQSPHPFSSRVHPGDEKGETGTLSSIGNYFSSGIGVFRWLTEIQTILDQLEWLEGKVQIVVAFVPVISKLISRQNISDSVILESSLSKRLGCYLFCDIANFTPLCESVSPDTAAKLLELFYDTVERAAEVASQNLLVKRLGDGIFIVWGFKLEVEKTKLTDTPLPALAYAAALRIAESVATLSEQTRDLIAQEAPDWEFSIRIGISTGVALHGLLKTETLVNPDVVGAAVNMAARCQTVGKLPGIKELSRRELCPPPESDRVLCTITTDLPTYHANTHLVERIKRQTPTSTGAGEANTLTTPYNASIAPTPTITEAALLAANSITAYNRYLVEDISLQGIGQTTLSVTFVTLQKALHNLPPDQTM
ncbi:hypothetical protein Pelo_7796 [Pelomyxa schiedti]|nr:hypothetical protein Pelo_7796 [Pelomyxa schiedti]